MSEIRLKLGLTGGYYIHKPRDGLNSRGAMRKVLAVLLLTLAGIQPARAQSTAATTPQTVEPVSFCDLMRHPDQYEGKTVKVTATYVADLEGASFFDEGCKKSESLPKVMANAKFTRNSDGTNKLTEFLRKKKLVPALASATIVAVFIDEYAGNRITGCSHCSRYTLEVTEVLAVEKNKSSPRSPD
jgi:hypothetical protein